MPSARTLRDQWMSCSITAATLPVSTGLRRTGAWKRSSSGSAVAGHEGEGDAAALQRLRHREDPLALVEPDVEDGGVDVAGLRQAQAGLERAGRAQHLEAERAEDGLHLQRQKLIVLHHQDAPGGAFHRLGAAIGAFGPGHRPRPLRQRLETRPVEDLQPFGLETDQPGALQLHHHPVGVDRRDAERVGDVLLGQRQPQTAVADEIPGPGPLEQPQEKGGHALLGVEAPQRQQGLMRLHGLHRQHDAELAKAGGRGGVDQIRDRDRRHPGIGQGDCGRGRRSGELRGHPDHVAGHEKAQDVPPTIGQGAELGHPAGAEEMEAIAVAPIGPLSLRQADLIRAGQPRTDRRGEKIELRTRRGMRVATARPADVRRRWRPGRCGGNGHPDRHGSSPASWSVDGLINVRTGQGFRTWCSRFAIGRHSRTGIQTRKISYVNSLAFDRRRPVLLLRSHVEARVTLR